MLTTPRSRTASTARVMAKVEWHPSELYPRIGFIVTNQETGRTGDGMYPLNL